MKIQGPVVFLLVITPCGAITHQEVRIMVIMALAVTSIIARDWFSPSPPASKATKPQRQLNRKGN
jgi:hypothetical protein